MSKTLNDYKNEKRRLENQINNQRRSNESIRNEISRLEEAYNRVGNIKRNNSANAERVKNDIKLNNVANSVEWRGNYKKQFDNVIKNDASYAARDFFDSIDRIHDEIGTALSRKRGELDTGSRILNGLNSAWNNVSGIIRNWFN